MNYIKLSSKELSEDDICKKWLFKDKTYISVICTTYNQEIYIRDAIEGFLAQECEYKFEIIIHDDCSTDNTALIIKEYRHKFPNIIKYVKPKNNLFSININRPLKNALNYSSGDYIALCEGDDFWIDKFKIQKQCAFLERNLDYGFVFTNINKLYQDSGKILLSCFSKDSATKLLDISHFIINKGFTAPCSWFMRREYSQYPIIETSDGTFCWFIYALANTKVYYLDEVTTVYRILQESASHSNNLFKIYNRELSINENQKFFAKKYKLTDYENKLIYLNKLIIISKYAFKIRDKGLLLNVLKKYRMQNLRDKKMELLYFLSLLPWGVSFLYIIYKIKIYIKSS